MEVQDIIDLTANALVIDNNKRIASPKSLPNEGSCLQ